MPPSTAAVATPTAALRRELHFFTLYRLLEAALLALLVFGPFLDRQRAPLLGTITAVTYAVVALVLFALGRHGKVATHAAVGICADLAAAALASQALPGAATSIMVMLLFNVAAAALLLPLRQGLAVALGATAIVIGDWGWAVLTRGGEPSLLEPVMFGLVYVATALLTSFVGREMRASQDLAERRAAEAANLAEVNELILRRLRTGVLVVDGRSHVRLANEAAMLLLGENGDRSEPAPHAVDLAAAAPELCRRLTRWRIDGEVDETPLKLAPDLPEVVPRFARLLAGSDQVLIFLDDASLVSRRAESITLATLGRFAASLAHEIRNPLAAINYAVQLLQESRQIPLEDRRLLDIIRQQGTRMNNIVENVLGMARREPAKPEHIELVGFVRQFAAEYGALHPLEQDRLHADSAEERVDALFDPRQLHQVLTVLVNNALRYGRQPGEAADVTLRVDRDPLGAPVIDVVDRGPGVSDAAIPHLFRPFFTTSGHGTGLGLYIARELCRANQASLDYVPSSTAGSRFRVRLSTASALLAAAG
ncbi:sensor histidine kinase [Vulcaniibacterium thermophilum]|uniref:histidine kinase n=1 Tax=Vulcaniibacterium thermophilum TaxID=1169913 RepID=A0A918Z130_9GAMM|nr:two-component sensor histidine kinase [Vulcaniibacterium thermophilum]